MTDVSNLDNLAAAIATSSPKIRDYAMAQATATQSQELEILSGGFLPAHAIRFVDAVHGLDTNDGLAPKQAKKTIQAAYNALPNPSPGGGRIILLPGRHDVGAGLSFQRWKPVVLQSITGSRANRGWGDQQQLGTVEAVLYRTNGGAGTSLVNISQPAGTSIGYGFAFRGVFFDQTADVQYGVYAESINGLMFYDCGAVTRTVTPAVEQYMIRARTDATGGDSSWGRVYNCETLGVGLLDGGNTGPSNFNQWVIRDNVAWGLGSLNRAVRLRGATRCAVVDNNFERAVSATPAAEEYIQCTACRSEGNAGEGTINPWLLDTDCQGCHWFPIGLYSGDDSVHTLVQFTGQYPYSASSRYALRGADWQPFVAPNIRRGYKDPNVHVAGRLGDLFLSFTGNGGGYFFVKTGNDGAVGGWTKVA